MRLRLMAFVSVSMALSWATTYFFSSSSMERRRLFSDSCNLFNGTPDITDTTSATSSNVTNERSVVSSLFHLALASSIFLSRSVCKSLNAAACSKFCSATAFSLSSLAFSSCLPSSTISGGTTTFLR